MEKQNKNNAHSFQPPIDFLKKIKVGVYKELHKKGLLTKKQLDELVLLQSDGVSFSLET